jgi:tetratricopeptide (TPR) repeat protein
MSRKVNDKRGTALALNSLGSVAIRQGDYPSARLLFEDGLRILRQVQDKRGIASSLQYLGLVAEHEGNVASAHTFYEESLTAKRELHDDQGAAWSLLNLADVAEQEGDYPVSRLLFKESLLTFRRVGDKSGIATCFEKAARWAASQGMEEHAARLWASAEGLREVFRSTSGDSSKESDHKGSGHKLLATGAQVSEAVWKAAWQEGRAMSMEQAIQYALEDS